MAPASGYPVAGPGAGTTAIRAAGAQDAAMRIALWIGVAPARGPLRRIIGLAVERIFRDDLSLRRVDARTDAGDVLVRGR